MVDKQAPCPFQPSICRSNTANIRLDTGFLDTASDLGVNAPKGETVQFRSVLHCAPLETRGYSENKTTSSGNFTVYNYGASQNGTNFRNETYMIRSVESQYKGEEGFEPRVAFGKNLILMSVHISVTEFLSHALPRTKENDKREEKTRFVSHNLTNLDRSMTSYVSSRVPNPNTTALLPIDELSRPDADVSLVFLAGNGIGYLEATEDLWYRATIRGRSLHLSSGSQVNESIPRYIPEEAASPMGCAKQYQFCNPSLPEESRCGPLASWDDAVDGAAPLFNLTEEQYDEELSDNATGARFSWLVSLLGSGSSIAAIISILSANALASQQYMTAGNLAEIPNDQWQLDVSRWFSIHLGAVQADVVATALGPTNPALDPYKYPPPDQHARKICNNQVGTYPSDNPTITRTVEELKKKILLHRKYSARCTSPSASSGSTSPTSPARS